MLPNNDFIQTKKYCINNYRGLGCSICKIENKNAIRFCVTDNQKICATCDKQHNPSHNIISIKEYIDKTFFIYYSRYSSVLNNKVANDTQMDENSKFLKINLDSLKIEYGNSWLNNELSNEDPLLTVGFVGFSGSGKSSTIGSLCHGSNYPIPGASGGTSSTSSDINAFLGETKLESKKLKYLILDSEGIGGTMAPSTLKCDNNQNKNEIFKARYDSIQISYTKLLYLISDVFIFTFKGALSEKGNVIKAIISFIDMASSISNNSTQPHLIILLNSSSTRDTERLDDIHVAKENFFKDLNGDILNNYFKSISVIYLPNIDENEGNPYQRYINQIEKLKHQINLYLGESLNYKNSKNINTSKSSTMSIISNLIRVLNTSSDGTCDIDCLEFKRSRGISSNFKNHLNQNIKKLSDFDALKLRPSIVRNNQHELNNNNIKSPTLNPVAIQNNNQTINNNNNIKSPTFKPTATQNTQALNKKSPLTNRKPPPPPDNSNSPSILSAQITKREPPPTPVVYKPSPNSKPLQVINNIPMPRKPPPQPNINNNEKVIQQIKKSPPQIPHNINNQSPNIIKPQSSSPSINSISNTVNILSNDNIVNNMVLFFNLNYNQFLNNSSLKRVESYRKSLELLKSKLVYTYNSYLKRYKVSIKNGEVCNNFGSILETASEEIFKLIPCGARIDTFECINYQDSHPIHQTKEKKTERKEVSFYVFSKKYIEIPRTREGNFISPLKKEEVDLLSFLKKQLKLNNSAKEVVPSKLNSELITFCGDLCVNCLLCSSTIRFSCGHILCVECSKLNEFKCPINKCGSEIYYKKEIDFNQYYGAKILCLDGGGGIRGIVECCALQIIQDSLFGIEICSLFDLIVGKSTGGLISILSSNNSPLEIIDSLKLMSSSIFTSSQSKSNPKYSRKQINEYLNGIKLKSPLKLTFEKTRIAVIAASLDEGQATECVFSNYYRKEEKAKHTFITECNSVDAVEGTLATPNYFSAFNFNGHDYLDGSIIDVNPCFEAINEFKLLWNDSNCKKVDLLLSLGNGLFDNIQNSNQTTFSNGESCWIRCKDQNKDILNDCNSFRVNQRFENEIAYDAKDQQSINLLKSSHSVNNGQTQLNKSINKLLSSLFYISNLQYSSNKSTITGTIQFKLERLPKELSSQLSRPGSKFSLNNSKPDTTFNIISQDYKADGPCLINFEIVNPTNTIDIICHLVSTNRIPNKNSISGCPFNL